MAPPRLLLVTIDRLPAWILPAWGATWVSAPALDALAGRGVVFDRLLATALDPRRTLDAIGGTLLATAARAGLRPALVTDGAPSGAPSVTATDDPGVVVSVVPAVVPRRAARRTEETNPGRLFAAARSAIAGGDHGLVWIHCGSLGVAWDAPPAFLEPYLDPDDPAPPEGVVVPSQPIDADTDPDLVMGHRQRFAAQVSLLDRCLGDLLAALAAGASAGDWTIAVVGVRGMALGLHGHVGLPATDGGDVPFGESIHLPALLVDARGRMAGQRHPGLVIPADIGVTLHRELGLRPDGDRDPGRDLSDLFSEWTHEARDRVICSAESGIAVVTPDWFYLESSDPPLRRLHAKPDDFFEVADVGDRCPEVVSALAEIVAAARVDENRPWTLPLGAAGPGG